MNANTLYSIEFDTPTAHNEITLLPEGVARRMARALRDEGVPHAVYHHKGATLVVAQAFNWKPGQSYYFTSAAK